MSLDKTLREINRRATSVVEKKHVENVLPEYFHTEYPKFAKFLEEYYNYSDSDVSPAKLIDELFLSRDITQVDIDLLSYIEDELLLGQQYFEGFNNKRAAATYSSTLYKAKGTKYSIEQFFRVFYNEDVVVEYPKENVFIIGNTHDLEKEKENANAGLAYTPEIVISGSNIGPDDQKYLTNNRLYQTYALLIKTALATDTWRDTYKLFVHPAGMYFGSEVQIVSISENEYLTMPDGIADSSDPIYDGVGSIAPFAINQNTQLVQETSGPNVGQTFAFNTNQLAIYSSFTISQFATNFDTIHDAGKVNSQTFDEDSAVGDSAYPRMSLDNAKIISFDMDL